jgi:hypothetical protein
VTLIAKKIYTLMALLFQLKMQQYIIVDQKAVTYKIFQTTDQLTLISQAMLTSHILTVQPIV